MDKKSIKISDLIKMCENHLKEIGYSEDCITIHAKKWQHGIKRYMDENSISEYSEEVGEQYLRIATKNQSPGSVSHKTRSVHILTDFLITGTIRKRIIPLVEYPLSGEIGEVAEKFLNTLMKLRRCDSTIRSHRRILSYFIESLSLREIDKIVDINEPAVLAFIDSAQHCKREHFISLRLFCRFIYEEKLIDKNFAYLFEKNNFPEREKIPSVYDAMEVGQMEASINQASAVGKRDYAIFLLASRLGLRSSDIRDLQFSNIDWDNSIIHLIQYKTKRAIELPLLKDVGEAIINYLKYGRPVSGSPLIFLSARSPYRALTGMSMSSIINRIIKVSGVKINNRKVGPHAMRHTMEYHCL
ncbi:MAG: tyrosine-type recombinase/integrase [Bacteroidales bacterium]|jgi:integrase|nr:tyrosine-type recombinase/integrase [Bacteroidales bacterium]